MHNTRFGYETNFTLKIDDDKALAAFNSDVRMQDAFCEKLAETLSYSQLSFRVHLDQEHHARVTITIEGIDTSFEEAIFELFHKDEFEDEDF